jgi:diguanylate cyclase
MTSTFESTNYMPEIMLIDDSSASLILLTRLLQEHGFLVRAADSGALAIESIRLKQPDIVLLDVRMPGMNGFEVCSKLKNDLATRNIPVIFITALGDTNSKVDGFNVGGSDFICKPFDEGEVLSRIKNQLEIAGLNKRLHETNRKLEIEKELLKITLMSIGDGVICCDNESQVTMMNEIAMGMTGWYGDSAIGKPFKTVFNIVNEATRKLDFDPMERVLRTGKIIGLANHTILISKDGIERPIADSAAPIFDNEGEIVGAVLVFRDVTREKNHINEIEYLSYHDQLTGLFNRRFFEEELRRLDTSRSFPLTLVMGDLNGLKMANDAFGHAAGDELLKKTAEMLKKCFRQEDIICRFGGDEFVMILPCTDIKTAEVIVRRFQDKLKDIEMEKGILSISFGWEAKTLENHSIWDILKCAEDNMYKMKMMDSPSVRSATINTIVKTLYEKNSREEEHSKRVSDLSAMLATSLNFSDADVNRVKTAGLLHDIGKIVVPDYVLEKPGNLDETEWGFIKKHPETGYRILSGSPEMADLADTILQHHERWDGGGYPNCIMGSDIDKFARIIAIADAYDAMTRLRPYKKSLLPEHAMFEIKDKAGSQFDPEYALKFVEMLQQVTE